MLRITLVTSALLALSATAARADQCAYVPQQQAFDAQKLVGKGADVIAYCEKCRGGGMKTLPPAQKAEVKQTSNGKYYQLSIDGKEVDLAYTFLRTGKHTYTNLALMVGCKTTGVSPSLDTSPVTNGRPAPPPPPSPLSPPSPPTQKAPPLGSKANPDMELIE